MTLLLLFACSDQSLVAPVSDKDGTDDSGPVEDTDTPAGACADLTLAPAGAATQALTCSPLGDVSWDLEVKYTYTDPVAENSLFGAPIAVPLAFQPRPTIVAQSGGGGLLGLDVVVGANSFTFLDVQNDLNGVAAANTSDGTGTGFVALATIEPYAVTVADLSTGTTAVSGPVSGYYSPTVFDTDGDGRPEIIAGSSVLGSDLTPVATTTAGDSTVYPVVADVDEDGDYDLVNESGIWDIAGGTGVAWSGLVGRVQPMPVLLDGAVMFYGADDSTFFLAGLDGVPVWTVTGRTYGTPAAGDVDGDGVPELIAPMGEYVRALKSDGTVLWTAQGEYSSGGLSIADLDADGAYEVINVTRNGLDIFDGATGATLASLPDVKTDLLLSPPIIVDADADGSLDIVLAGAADGAEMQSQIVVVGPINGRWARGRQVWNQFGYDAVTVADDGGIVAFPEPSWRVTNAWRAQPGYDGDHPDLIARLTDACADSCDTGPYRLAVQVENLGTMDAAAGAVVRLRTWTAAGGMIDAASVTLAEGVAAGQSVAGFELEVAAADWGDRQFLQVDGADADECNPLNDRIPVLVDPCAP